MTDDQSGMTPRTSAACCVKVPHDVLGPLHAADCTYLTQPDPVELVLRHHLSVKVGDDGPWLCICDVTAPYDGPMYHRLHVVDELRKAGLLRD